MLSKLYLDMFCLSVPRDFEAELQQCGSCRGWAGARSQIWRTSSQRHWALQGEPFYQPYLTLMVLQQMRKEMVDQKEGMNRLTVKVHMDDMKRVTIREQNYFYHNISNTPFTLGIAFPSKYGQFRVTGGTEITRNKADGGWIKISNDLPHSLFHSGQSVQLRPLEAAPRLGVLRVQLRRVERPPVWHTGEQHEALPWSTLPWRGQVQLGLIQVQWKEDWIVF